MQAIQKIVVPLFFLILVISVSATYYKTFVIEDLVTNGTLVELTDEGLYLIYYQNNEALEFESTSADIETAIQEFRNDLLDNGIEPDENFNDSILEAFLALEK